MSCRSGCLTPGAHEDWCLFGKSPAQFQKYWAQLLASGNWRCHDCAQVLPLSEFYLRKSGQDAGRPTASFCKTHLAIRDSRTDWKYNVNYDELLAEQGGVCSICATSVPGGKGKFHVDHDHKCCPGKNSCGKCVRGLLCHKCNVGLGMFGDDLETLERAVGYARAALSIRV